jgi:uncharacterized protein (TIGR02246 family)
VSLEDDLAAIEELHRRDMDAARRGDFAALRGIVDDDAVMLAPDSWAQHGRAELDAAFESMARAPRTHDVLEYELRFQEVKVLGDYAYEWGSINGTMREIATGDVARSAFHVMRILKRQADGSWRVYRSIWARAPE